MHAVLMCPHFRGRGLLPALVPLMGKPFAQHVVECLPLDRVRFVHFVHAPEAGKALAESLGDGARWGVRLLYHEWSGSHVSGTSLRSMCSLDEDAATLVGRLDCLPKGIGVPPCTASRFLYWQHDRLRWTGWAWLLWAQLHRMSLSLGHAEQAAAPPWSGALRIVPRPLDVSTCSEVLESQRSVLRREAGSPVLFAQEVKPGVFVARHARLHASARLIPPVYVGERCVVGRTARLGPDVSVTCDCIVDGSASLENAILLPRTYVRAGAVIHGAIAGAGWRIPGIGRNGFLSDPSADTARLPVLGERWAAVCR